MELKYKEGQTPIDVDEKRGLKIKSISTMEELDEFEQQNIEEAVGWAHGRTFKPEQVITATNYRLITHSSILTPGETASA